MRYFNENTAWALKVAGKFMTDRAIKGFERVELEQAALVGLWEASLKFEKGHGRYFKQFAIYRIRGRMYDVLRYNDCRFVCFEDIIVKDCDQVQEHEDLEVLLSVLPVKLRRLAVRHYILGETQKEISQSIGLSAHRVCQLFREIRDVYKSKQL